MARITWTDEALRWLKDIYEHIAQDDSVAAAQTVEGIYERAQVLLDFMNSHGRVRSATG